MKMLWAIEFLVPRRPDAGAGTPTSAIPPFVPQTYGSPRSALRRQQLQLRARR
jgi:hypothetical protein